MKGSYSYEGFIIHKSHYYDLNLPFYYKVERDEGNVVLLAPERGEGRVWDIELRSHERRAIYQVDGNTGEYIVEIELESSHLSVTALTRKNIFASTCWQPLVLPGGCKATLVGLSA